MEKYMKAVVVREPGIVEVVNDVPVPEVGDYEALVKVKACGFCNGTDFKIITGTFPSGEGNFKYPLILGHEGTGEIIEVGKKVRYLKAGDRILRTNLHPEPMNGYYNADGGMAEYGLTVDQRAMREDGFKDDEIPFLNKTIKLPDGFDFLDGCAALCMSETYTAALNFGVKPGDHVLVFGSGPMGLGIIRFMKYLGAEHVTVIDCRDDRLALAKSTFCADESINFETQNVRDIIGSREFDLAVDAVGSTAILLDGSKYLKQGGCMCMLGVPRESDRLLDILKLKNNTRLHMLTMPYREYEIIPEICNIIKHGDVDPDIFYTHIFKMDEIHKAIDHVVTKSSLKCMIDIDL